MKEVLASDTLETELERLAGTMHRPVSELRQRARRDFAEMHCRRNRLAIRLFAALGRFVRQRGYDHRVVYDHEEVERLRGVSRRHSVVYLATHKTYLDFFVLFDFLFRQGLATPYIFGGINMNFAGFGGLARRAGGIFIRRSFRDDPIYKAVLQAYMDTLIADGAAFMWAIEGTRSRTGRLLMPRLGLLNYVVQSSRRTGKPVAYVPVSVVYDQIPDVIDMAAQEAGAVKRPESLSWFLHYLKGMGGPYGNITVRLGEPMAPTDTPDAPDLEPVGGKAAQRQIEIQKLAFEVCYRINEITPATMTSLIVTVLLCRGRCDANRMRRDIDALNAYIVKTDRRVIMKRPSRLLDSDPADSIDALLANGVIRFSGNRREGVLEIDPARLAEAIYYSNMAAHHFVISALVETALAASNGPDDILPECRRLRKLLKFEFFFSRSEVFGRQVESELAEIDPGWQRVLREEGNRAALSMLRSRPLLVGAGILSPFVHAYHSVAEGLNLNSGSEYLDDDLLIARCLQADRAAASGDDSLRPVASTALLRNGLRLVENLGLRSADARDRRAAFLEELEHTRRAFRCLQVIAQHS